MKTSSLLLASASFLLAAHTGSAGVVVSGFNANTLPANDDGYTGLVPLPFAINFFGTTYSNTYVNNNGNLTFTAPLGTYTPFNLYTTGMPIIAPFFADVDTRGAGSALLAYGNGTYDGKTAFGATWDGVGVGYFSYGTDKLNNFQTLLVDRSDTGAGNFDIYFNYDRIQWETGDASGGTGGLGGSSARAGYSSGAAATSYEIPGSAVNGAFLDTNLSTGLIYGTNVGVPGRYLFTVRNGEVIVPPIAGVPDAGSTLALLSLALAALAAVRRARS